MGRSGFNRLNGGGWTAIRCGGGVPPGEERGHLEEENVCAGEENLEMDITGKWREERVGRGSRKRWTHPGGERGRMDGNREGGAPRDPTTEARRGGAGGPKGFGVRGMPGTGASGDPGGGGAGVLEPSGGKGGSREARAGKGASRPGGWGRRYRRARQGME